MKKYISGKNGEAIKVIEKIEVFPQHKHTVPPIDVYILANKINEIIEHLENRELYRIPYIVERSDSHAPVIDWEQVERDGYYFDTHDNRFKKPNQTN